MFGNGFVYLLNALVHHSIFWTAVHVRGSSYCHAVQARPLSELLQLVLLKSHVLCFVRHRKFLRNLSGLLSQSLQGVSYAMATTIPSVVKCDRPANSCVHCRPKRKGWFSRCIKVKLTFCPVCRRKWDPGVNVLHGCEHTQQIAWIEEDDGLSHWARMGFYFTRRSTRGSSSHVPSGCYNDQSPLEVRPHG